MVTCGEHQQSRRLKKHPLSLIVEFERLKVHCFVCLTLVGLRQQNKNSNCGALDSPLSHPLFSVGSSLPFSFYSHGVTAKTAFHDLVVDMALHTFPASVACHKPMCERKDIMPYQP